MKTYDYTDGLLSFFFFYILHKCYANNCGPRRAEAPALLPVFLNTLMLCEGVGGRVKKGYLSSGFNPLMELSLRFPVHVANRCCRADLKSNMAFNT